MVSRRSYPQYPPTNGIDMRLLRSPVTQFLVAGLLTILVILMVTRCHEPASGEEGSDQPTPATVTEVLAHSVAEPEVTGGLVRGDAGCHRSL